MVDAHRSEARAEARRRQILDAAEACFRARGFHAATIAEIAGAAGLSVGQIYRFFENKEAIIEAITDQQMEEFFGVVARVEGASGAADAIRMLLSKGFEKLSHPGAAALMLEVTAEAARNPRIAGIVCEHDRQIREAISSLLSKALGPVPREVIDRRAEYICLILEGVAARLIRHPGCDRDGLALLQETMMSKLLSPPEAQCAFAPQAGNA